VNCPGTLIEIEPPNAQVAFEASLRAGFPPI
jgi:hypothetical protein